VRGTIFEVAAREGHIASVSVSEGKVEVRYRGAISLVTAGGAWRPPADGGEPAAVPSADASATPAVAPAPVGVGPGTKRRQGPPVDADRVKYVAAPDRMPAARPYCGRAVRGAGSVVPQAPRPTPARSFRRRCDGARPGATLVPATPPPCMPLRRPCLPGRCVAGETTRSPHLRGGSRPSRRASSGYAVLSNWCST